MAELISGKTLAAKLKAEAAAEAAELREKGVCIRNLGRALASGAFLYDARNIRKRGTEHETHGETQ